MQMYAVINQADNSILAVGDLRHSQLLGRIFVAQGLVVKAPPVECIPDQKLRAAALATIPNSRDLAELEAEALTYYPDGFAYPPKPIGGTAPKAKTKRPDQKSRPAPTTMTGLVWVLCDQAAEGLGADYKAIRVAAKSLAKTEEINEGTFAVQYSKWKNDRVAAAA